MKKIYLFVLYSSVIFSHTAFANGIAERSHLCLTEENQVSFAKSIESRNSDEISLITWNAHKFDDSRFFDDLKHLSQDSDILMVQEAMHSSSWQQTLASQLPMSFSFFKSFCNGDFQATGVMTAARGLLEFNRTLTSPKTEPITATPKVSGYSQVVINNQVIHLINTHALNFNTGEHFEMQIDSLAKFIANLQGPVIWAGDFNTWNPGRLSFLNDRAQRVAGLRHLTPALDRRFLVLDHVYVRGLEPIKIEVLTENSSDHFPIRAVFKLNSKNFLMTHDGFTGRH